VKPRLPSALAAGSIAIIVNTLALKAADLISLPTAKGGLLRLVSSWSTPILGQLGMTYTWTSLELPTVASPFFQTGFHLFVGMLMALFYGYIVEPLLPGLNDILKGATYAVIVWILNAFVVLPLTSEGIAGVAHLTIAGILWYAAAHTLFFLILAQLYGVLRNRPASATPALRSLPDSSTSG
jgi:hypothetical protein